MSIELVNLSEQARYHPDVLRAKQKVRTILHGLKDHMDPLIKNVLVVEAEQAMADEARIITHVEALKLVDQYCKAICPEVVES